MHRAREAAACILAAVLLGWGAAGAAGGDRAPYRDLSRSDTGFNGPGRELSPPSGLAAVKLGLLGPGKRPEGDRLREGAALAVAEANARGGLGGLPYEAVFRPDDGPWGMGAKQVVALACEDSTWGIVGGLTGGDAHLAELVAAKLWIPVITPTAGDLSIDYANVPWVFRCSPSDRREACRLLAWVREHGLRRVLVLAEDDRDGRTGVRRLTDAARTEGIELLGPRAFQPHRAAEAVDPGDLAGADAAVIWAGAEGGRSMLRAVRQAGFAGPVLGPAGLLGAALPEGSEPGTLLIAASYDPSRDDARWRAFRERYRTATGREPDAVALYAYDAAALLIAAIEQAGLNRARIRDALASADHDGIAGRYRFNGLGGSGLEPVLVTRRDGAWVRVLGGAGGEAFPGTRVGNGGDR